MKNAYNSLIALVFLALIGFAAQAQNETSGYKAGDVATDFKLKNVDGKMVSMADYKDAKGFIVIFTCNTCPYAVLYEDRIIDLDKKFKSKGYPVIAINPNDPAISSGDSYNEMKKRAADKGFTFPYIFDETQEVTKKYGATRTPHVYIVNKEGGNLKVAYVGAIDDNHKDASAVTKRYVEDAIGQLLNKEAVAVDFTKAIGCTIKWKQKS